MTSRNLRPAVWLLLSLTTWWAVAAAAPAADEPKGGPPEFKHLKFRSIGPAAGGRVCRVAGVPGDPHVYYAATAAGGVWKSEDGGIRWKPIFDDQPIATIGSIAVSPSDPNVIYAGSGEANIRGNVEPGNGIYKSVDAGKTWKHVWKHEGQIGTMLVHPTNPEIAYAAVLGHAFGPNDERGVYRTTDGGKTWLRVLFKDKDTGASDVCFDPTSPKVLFAGLWQTRRRPWEMTSGGPGSGLYVSRDGGDSWTQLIPALDKDSPDAGKDAPEGKKFCEGLPEGIWGKVTVGVAPSDGRRVYALIEAEKGGLCRSDDGGDTWKLINENRSLRQRAWYFSCFTIHPKNPDVIFFPQVPLLKSIDGGKSLVRVKGTHHGDHHDLWIDPKNPDRMIECNDGGVDVTTNGGETWYAPPLPIAQFYHVGVDERVPYHVAGAMQDIAAAQGPSNSLHAGGISVTDWYPVGGGEAGFTVPDPTDPNIVYGGEYGGVITRYDRRTRQAKNVSIYPYDPSGHGGEDLKYRFQWTAPILVSRHDGALYHGANVLFKSTDKGESWTAISKDLTRNDKDKQHWSGGPITGDNTGVEVYCTIFALAESPKKAGLLWAGSDDGLVHVTRDGGKTWDNVTPNIKGMPEWGTVLCIEPSPFDADTAYLVVDNHRMDDMKPYLFKTTDGGKTWTSLTDKLPKDVFLRVVREDPKKKGMLYLGTERGLWFSTDGGAKWVEWKLNLPTVAVSDLVIKDDDLVVCTSGRSLWIFDDLTPIREYTPATADAEVHLFPPRPAYRWRQSGALDEGPRAGAGDNPPEGAIVHFSLKSKPKADVVLEIFDDKAKLVRKLTSKEEEKEEKDDLDEEGDYGDEKKEKEPLPAQLGLHRFVWDMRYEGAEVLKKVKIDGGEPKVGPLVLPGTYTLKLTADGKTETAKLEVKPDPRLSPRRPAPPPAVGFTAPTDDLGGQIEFALRIRDDLTRLVRTVQQLRAVKKQLADRNDLLKGDDKAEPLVKASKEFTIKLDALEEKLHNPKAKVNYDILAQKGGAKVYSQLAWVFETLKDADGAPTQGEREVYAEQVQLLDQLEKEWKDLVTGDLAKLNDQAKKLELPEVFVPPLGKKEKEPEKKP
jgi:photosystem II stability/assembly factor-like uncharacterized protein